MVSERGEDSFEDWEHAGSSFCFNDHVPGRLEFLPSGGIGHMPEPVVPSGFGPGTLENRTPAVEIAIGAPVPSFQHIGGQFCRAVDDMAGIVEIPVAMEQAPLLSHTFIECRCWIGG